MVWTRVCPLHPERAELISQIGISALQMRRAYDSKDGV
jgi:hypothetical protein